MADSPWVVDVTTEQFEAQVVNKSAELPVIVDFWGPSCQPCRQLGPLIEQLVNEAAGAVILAKVNVEQEQQLAQMLGVQSIPLVVAFHEGQVVDQFVGLVPEEELREFVGRLVPSRASLLIKEALELEESDQVTAEAKLREALELEPSDATKIHLARVLMAQGRNEDASAIITDLEVRGFLEPDAERIKAELDIRANAQESGGVQEARAAAAANPEDLSLQVSLGDALAADGNHRDACDVLLAVVSRDRSGEAGTAAKDQMVKLFEVLGSGNAIVTEFRRKLATALY